MKARVATWPGGADFPLNLMIDDLADVFVEHAGMSRREKDWGHLLDGPGSAWELVERELLARWPELKISLYIPVNRQPVRMPAPQGSYYGSIDARPEMVEFLRRLDASPHVECAYHGKDHFRELKGERVQEWLSYQTVDEAVEETKRGLEIFERVFQRPAWGGKFPGYASRETSEASILASGFRWWCWRFNRGAIQSVTAPREQLEARFVGPQDCVDLPTTMAGNILPPYLPGQPIRWIKRFIQRRSMRTNAQLQIQQIHNWRLPLTLQEHIAPSRADGKRQGVNLQDDLSGLHIILGMAHRFCLWHAHPTEIADHLLLRKCTRLEIAGGELLVDPPACALLEQIEIVIDGAPGGVRALQDTAGQKYLPCDTADGSVFVLPVKRAAYRIIEG